MPNEVTTTEKVHYLKLSNDLLSRLNAIKATSIIAKFIMDSLAESQQVTEDLDSFNYLGISSEDSTKISYLTNRRLSSIVRGNEFQTVNLRYHSSAGKVVRKLFQQIAVTGNSCTTYEYLLLSWKAGKLPHLTEKSIERPTESRTLFSYFTEQDFDQFNNAFRLEGYKQLDGSDIKLVTGHWISHFYLMDNYASLSGNLGNSCMRYSTCQSFLQIYTTNPKLCSLAVIVNSECKLQARALVWTVNGVKYHDRIYATSDVIQDKMRAFFLTQDIESCYHGDSGYVDDLVIYADTNNNDFMERIDLDFENYPYMDSFKYLNEEKKILSNSDSTIDHEYTLNETDGSVTTSPRHAECDCCGAAHDTDDLFYISERADAYRHNNLCAACVVYSETLGEHISYESSVHLSNGDYTCSNYAVRLPDGDYIREEEAVELDNGNYAHRDDFDLVEFHYGGWFLKSETDYVEYNDEYYRITECVETRDEVDIPKDYTVEVNGEIWEKDKWELEQNLNLI